MNNSETSTPLHATALIVDNVLSDTNTWFQDCLTFTHFLSTHCVLPQLHAHPFMIAFTTTIPLSHLLHYTLS